MADAVRRGRGVGARGRLRRRAARLGQRQAARPVPLAVLQPPHRRVRRITREAGRAILRLIRDAVAERAGRRLPVQVKVPAETAPPGFPRTTHRRRARAGRLVEEWGFDAVTPVEVSVFPDTTLSRGGVPDSFWTNKGMADAAARRRAVAAPARDHQGRRMVGRPARAVRAGVEPRPVHRGDAPGPASRCSPSAASAPRPRCTRSSTPATPTWSASAARSTPSPTSRARILGDARRPGPVPELEPVRRGADARHEGRLLQPRRSPSGT